MTNVYGRAKQDIFRKRSEIEEIKNRRFRKIVRYVYENSPLYRKKFKESGVDIDRIKSVEDLSVLPFTTKQELRESYPLKAVCVPKEKVVRIQMSGGTTGQPVIIPYTRHDVEQWKEMMMRAFFLANVTERDIIQITPAFGLWNGGFGFHFAADAINAFVIPIGPGNTRNQIRFMVDFGTTVLAGTASYPLRIAEVADEMGIDVAELNVEKLILGAEPWSEEMRRQIEKTFDARAYDIPGLTEMGGVGTVGFECPEREGLHIWEDNYIVEVVDPETGEVLDEGEEGEIVYTALNREGMPLIRYRSGEISTIIGRDGCECGIEHIKIKRIRGRTDDMIIYKGVKFYPTDVESILAEHGVVNYRILAINGRLEIVFEGDERIKSAIAKDLAEFVGIHPAIKVVPIGQLERFEGKARRLIRG
ncbi:phenylacetate--CoA ligase family protein [Geoglobus acetivorans]|uniref:Phenylacetate-coenzyme A ligase n=1 Tax=Geoglobus acetivorans TaxID=565033 RepID=A0A0A7GG31_GEOAI|nr:Phenylacetate-coenzyme A ligase [Geoglobus acetivorans]